MTDGDFDLCADCGAAIGLQRLLCEACAWAPRAEDERAVESEATTEEEGAIWP